MLVDGNISSLFSPTMMWKSHGHLPLSVISSSGSLSRRASGPGRGTWPSAWPPLLSPGSHSSPGSPVETTKNRHEHSSCAENRACFSADTEKFELKWNSCLCDRHSFMVIQEFQKCCFYCKNIYSCSTELS